MERRLREASKSQQEREESFKAATSISADSPRGEGGRGGLVFGLGKLKKEPKGGGGLGYPEIGGGESNSKTVFCHFGAPQFHIDTYSGARQTRSTKALAKVA